MEELIKSVVCAECEEYGRASVSFGAVNNSDHESYAILREEVDEAIDALSEVDDLTDGFFELVKQNEEDKTKIGLLNVIKHRAEEAAAESIQAAAMARKAIETIQRRASE